MEKLERKALKKQFSSIGWALLLVIIGMNLCVYLVGIVDVAFLMLSGNSDLLNDQQLFSDRLMQNGWGYLLTVLLGLVLILVWKGTHFCTKVVWTRGKPMTAGAFFKLLSLFLGSQMLFQYYAMGLEAFLNQFGLSALDDIESATRLSETVSMYLYVCVAAPIWEELLFRGLILRMLEPHGKRFAIFLSAFLFGMFHGNLVQVPYAFIVGLVLGYVAIEYNIGWSMVLHMINNLVLADLMYRLTQHLPAGFGDMITWLLIQMCAVIGVITLFRNRRQAASYSRENPMNKGKLFSFFTSAGVITALAVMTITTILPLILQMI